MDRTSDVRKLGKWGAHFLIGVKTRNMYQVNGLLNSTYNVRKRAFGILAMQSEAIHEQLRNRQALDRISWH
jgi:hypothetical protein